MAEPVYFATPADFRAWLAQHAATRERRLDQVMAAAAAGQRLFP